MSLNSVKTWWLILKTNISKLYKSVCYCQGPKTDYSDSELWMTTKTSQKESVRLNKSMGEEAICDPHNKSKSHVFLEKFTSIYSGLISVYTSFLKNQKNIPNFILQVNSVCVGRGDSREIKIIW